jgi:hypothetical protein
LFVPKKRRLTKPTRASRIRLEATKTQRSRTKKLRSTPDW